MKNEKIFTILIIILVVAIALFGIKFNFAIKTNETAKISEPYVVEELVDAEIPVNETIPYGIRECRETTYNYSLQFDYSYPIINNSIMLLCSLNVTNLEQKPGNFNFYIRIYKGRNITVDYLDQTKEIKANETANFEWYDNITNLDNLPTCEYKIKEIPRLEKCEYTPSGFYTTKEGNRTAKVLRNITKYREIELPKYEVKKMSVASYLISLL